LTINPTAASTINNTSIGATTASTGRFTSVTATTGSVVISTSGQGIDFSATPGTGTSELLNDYEEGTWSPTANSFVVVGAPSLTGTYTKIGRLVTVYIYFSAATSIAATAQTSNFTNFPFVIARNTVNSAVLDDQTAVGQGLVNTSSSGTAYVGANIVATNRDLVMTFTYEV
jgi:hypothetical protein